MPRVDTPDTVLCCNVEAEQAVLGAVLLDSRVIEELRVVLDADDFYREPHRRLYRACVAVVGRGAQADVVTVSDELKRRGDLQSVGGMGYLADLAASVPTTANALYYAGLVADQARLRRLDSAARQIQAVVRERDAVAEVAISEAERLLSEARVGGVWRPSAEWMGDAVETRWNAHLDPSRRSDGLNTGLRDLDAMIGGLRPGEVTVLAGRPSMGKTALALQIARHAAKETVVLLYSLETSVTSIADRLIALDTGLRIDLLRQGQYGRASLERHQAEVDELLATRLWVSDRRGVTSEQIASEAWRMRREGMGLLMVDYLTLIADRRERGRTDAAHVGDISRRLQQLAGQLGIPVVVLSQLSRDVERREDKRPTMSDLRDSGQIEQDAHLVLLLYRPEYYGKHPKGIAEVIVAKQKDGPVGSVHVGYRPWCGRFFDVDESRGEGS